MNEDVIRSGESPQEYRGRLLRQISNGNISSMDNHDRVHGALAYIDSIKQHYEGRDRNINLVVTGTGTDGGAKIGFVVQGIHPKGNHIIAQPAAKGAPQPPQTTISTMVARMVSCMACVRVRGVRWGAWCETACG